MNHSNEHMGVVYGFKRMHCLPITIKFIGYFSIFFLITPDVICSNTAASAMTNWLYFNILQPGEKTGESQYKLKNENWVILMSCNFQVFFTWTGIVIIIFTITNANILYSTVHTCHQCMHKYTLDPGSLYTYIHLRSNHHIVDDSSWGVASSSPATHHEYPQAGSSILHTKHITIAPITHIG